MNENNLNKCFVGGNIKIIMIFSFILALTMIFSILCINAFAADPVTWNQNDKDPGITLSNNNLTLAANGGDWHSVRSTVSKTTGKWYSEFKVDSLGGSNQVMIGIGNASAPLNNYSGADANGIGYFLTGGVYIGSVLKTTYASYTTGDIISVALDCDAKTVTLYKNGVSQGPISYTFSNSVYMMGNSVDVNSKVTANFGATSFAYPLPTGYLPFDNSSVQLPTLEITSTDTAKVGDVITANVVIHNANNICAEDIKFTYDTTRLEYISAVGSDGIKIYNEDKSINGVRRYISASLGKTNAANGDKILLKLTFKAKSVGQAKIDITKGRIADNSTVEMDLLDSNCGEKTITIEGVNDVNRSGEYTLLDLGIDAWYYGDDVSNTDTTKYDADQDGSGTINDADLTIVVNGILNNSSYSPSQG